MRRKTKTRDLLELVREIATQRTGPQPLRDRGKLQSVHQDSGILQHQSRANAFVLPQHSREASQQDNGHRRLGVTQGCPGYLLNEPRWFFQTMNPFQDIIGRIVPPQSLLESLQAIYCNVNIQLVKRASPRDWPE